MMEHSDTKDWSIVYPVHSKCIEYVIVDCPGTVNISDNIFIFGKTLSEHDENLDNVLTKLKQHGLWLNPNKCEFSKSQIIFSAYLFTDKGILPDNQKLTRYVHSKHEKTKKKYPAFLV